MSTDVQEQTKAGVLKDLPLSFFMLRVPYRPDTHRCLFPVGLCIKPTSQSPQRWSKSKGAASHTPGVPGAIVSITRRPTTTQLIHCILIHACLGSEWGAQLGPSCPSCPPSAQSLTRISSHQGPPASPLCAVAMLGPLFPTPFSMAPRCQAIRCPPCRPQSPPSHQRVPGARCGSLR